MTRQRARISPEPANKDAAASSLVEQPERRAGRGASPVIVFRIPEGQPANSPASAGVQPSSTCASSAVVQQ